MSRVFLSHSSADKSFVEPIANLLGKNNCVYDKYTFDIGMKTIEEIFDCMDKSDIFVYFISENSLNSKWVKDELNKAEELLSSPDQKIKQIYPLIIDSNINHSDSRIAIFLRKQYNLQRVESPVLAYRKILQQVSRNNYENEIVDPTFINSYYGRDSEITDFRRRIDSTSSIKSAVISGIPGIGKKSFINQALKHARIIKPYYSPITLSMPKNGCIDDLIAIICEAGFGTYTLESVSQINSIEEKISILKDLINKIQRYKEIIILEDDETIISLNGDIKYWFYNAINQSDNGLALLLTSTVNVQKVHTRNFPCVFFCDLAELDMSDRSGLLRSSAENLGLDLSESDRVYFKDCLTGYPPQIIFCAEMIKNEGLDYAKDHTAEIASMPEQISSVILEKCQEKCDAKYLDGILSVIAKLEIAPIRLINKICKINTEYQNAVITLKQFSVCYVIGANNEYIKMNSFIENFVTRNKLPIPADIQKILDDELDVFNKAIESNEELNNWETSELKYHLKSNLKKTGNIKSSFLYSTVVLQTIMELYHDTKYSQVINLFDLVKENERYQYFDDSVKVTLQRYYCQSLVKTKNVEFEAQVEFFAQEKKWAEYYFLKGFWYRYTGRYADSEWNFNKVLEHNANHLATKRELVIIYLSTQDYDSALELAKSNYKRRKDNLFHLQAYMECLLEQKQLDEAQEADIAEMLSTLKLIHKTSPNSIYYQVMGKYEAYKNKDLKLALEYIEEGLKKFPNQFYLIRDKFDIYRKFNNIHLMEATLKQLSDSMGEYKFKGVIFTRTAILRLYKGEPVKTIRIYLQENGFSEKVIDNIINRYSRRLYKLKKKNRE